MNIKGNIIWSPQKKQAIFLARNEYEVLYGGAAGGGKSDALLVEALRQVDKPQYRALILRKTVPQLRELIDRSMQLYQSAFPSAKYKVIEHMWQFDSGAKIYFASMNHPNDRYSYQGQRFDYIAFDELTHFSADEYFYMLSRNRPGAAFMRCYIRASANPGGLGHAWVKQRFIDPSKPYTPIKESYEIKKQDGRIERLTRSRIFIPSTVFDNNALLKNSPNYVSSLAMLPEAEKRALLYGDWNSFSGQVFSEFVDDSKHYADGRYSHVIDEYIPKQEDIIYRGFDFGYSKPFAVCWFCLDNDKRIYMINELYGSENCNNKGLKWTPEQIAKKIKEVEENSPLLKGRKIIGIADPSIFDASRGVSIAEQMSAYPNNIHFLKGDNARLAGKMQIHNRLIFDENGRANFYLSKNCVNSIRCLKNICYSKTFVEDVDSDMEDHCYDVIRYVLMARPISLQKNPEKTNFCLELSP